MASWLVQSLGSGRQSCVFNQTTLAAILTCLSNVGPGFGTVGPVNNFAGVPDAGKLMLALLMVVGRLEIYTVVLLFTIGFWRR